MRRPTTILAAMLLALTLVAPGPALACPNCKEAVGHQNDPNAQRLATGFSYSIYLMIGMPVLLLGAGSLALARAARLGIIPEL